MDYFAVFNRSLLDVTGMGDPAHLVWDSCGDLTNCRQVEVPYQPIAGSIQGYKWLPQQLRPAYLIPPGGFSFKRYATPWEQQNSVLAPGRRGFSFAPVVDHAGFTGSAFYPVIAHYGQVDMSQIIVPRKLSFGSDPNSDTDGRLAWILRQDNVPAYVEKTYPDVGDWAPLAAGKSTEHSKAFLVLTDPDGRILGCVSAGGGEPGLEPGPIFGTALDYVAMGLMIIDLVAMGSRLLPALICKGEKAAAATTPLSKAKAKWASR
jgi:hypothetical protein